MNHQMLVHPTEKLAAEEKMTPSSAQLNGDTLTDLNGKYENSHCCSLFIVLLMNTKLFFFLLFKCASSLWKWTY